MSLGSPLPRSVPAHVPPHLVFEFDIYADPRIDNDVQGSYAKALRDAPDIFFTPANGGHWMVRRAEMITAILKEYEYFSVREAQIPRVPNPPQFIPLSLDPPANIPYRMALAPQFSPKAVQAMEPKIREWAVRIVDSVADKGECDFLYDISAVYPVSIFMEIMGMDLGRLRDFRILADKFFNSHTPEEYAEHGGAIQAEMSALIAQRRQSPGDDLVSRLLTVAIDGRPINDEEMLAMCYILFLGGMDTVTNVTGFAFQHLAQDEALQQRLADDPSRITDFVEEALRLFPVASPPRLVTQDCERFGVQFKAGEMVLCSPSEGGRDDRLHDSPNAFDLDRKNREHLTFSAGPHLCVGHILARAEMKALTEEWFRRVPKFRLKEGVRRGFRVGTVHAIETLPITWTVAR